MHVTTRHGVWALLVLTVIALTATTEPPVVLLVLATVALAGAGSTVRLAFEPAPPPPRA